MAEDLDDELSQSMRSVKGSEIEMEGATITADQRQYFHHGGVTAEALTVNGVPIAIAKASDLPAFLHAPSVKGKSSPDALGKSGIYTHRPSVDPADVLTPEKLKISRDLQAKYATDLAEYRRIPTYLYGEGGKAVLNPDKPSRPPQPPPDDWRYSDGVSNFGMAVPIGGGWYQIPGLDVGGGRPLFVINDDDSLSRGSDALIESPDKGRTLLATIHADDLKDKIPFPGSAISNAWKNRDTPAPPPAPEPESSWDLYEMPIEDTPKGRRRVPRRFSGNRDLSDDLLVESMRGE